MKEDFSPDRQDGPMGSRPWRLGPWHIDPTTGELRHLEAPKDVRRLEPRVMDLLIFFACHPRRVLTKDRLLAAVWPDVVVQEVALARAVSALRRELGDDARSPRWIETVPKRGYRLLVEPKTQVEPDAFHGTDTASPHHTEPSRNGGKGNVEKSGVEKSGETGTSKETLGARAPFLPHTLLLGVLILILFWALQTTRPVKVMVLPLVPLTQDPTLRFVAEGLSQDIRDRLAQIPDLRVSSGTTSRHYRSFEADVSEIRSKEDVQRLLDGSLESLDDRRLVLRLHWVDTEVDRQIWSYKEELERDDLNLFRGEILGRALVALEESLPGTTQAATPSATASRLDGPSFELYLRARARYRRYSPADNAVAVELFEKALDHRPSNDGAALYTAGLANALALQVANYDGDLALAAKAEALARSALDLDPGLPEAHKALGLALGCMSRPRQALKAYQRALEIRPHYDEALHNRAFLKQQLGEWDEAGRWQGGRRRLERPLM